MRLSTPRPDGRALTLAFNHQSQSRSEESLQGGSDRCLQQTRSVSGVLRGTAGQGNPARYGTSNAGAQDCGNHFVGLEERSPFRRPVSKTTSSLSVSDQSPLHPGDLLWWCRRVLRDTRVRERVSTSPKLGAVCLGHRVSQPTLGPLGQPEKAIGHESPIEPWLALDHRSALRVSGLMASLRQVMKTAGRRNPNRWVTAPDTPSPWHGRSELLLDQVGWEARKTPAVGGVFFLDFLIYKTSQMG